MSKIGTADIKGIMLGSAEISKAYLGSDIVYQNAVPAPEGYEWCEYIQNTSSAYINTGCYPDSATQIEMVMENVTNAAFKGILGVARTGSYRWGVAQHASSSTAAEFSYGNVNKSIGTIAEGTKTTIVINGNKLTRNGTAYTNTGTWTGGALSNPMYVFREYAGGTNCALMKLYSLKITIGGVLLRDYVPIKRLEDNKYGLWDKVNQNFVTSASSSAFTGG